MTRNVQYGEGRSTPSAPEHQPRGRLDFEENAPEGNGGGLHRQGVDEIPGFAATHDWGGPNGLAASGRAGTPSGVTRGKCSAESR